MKRAGFSLLNIVFALLIFGITSCNQTPVDQTQSLSSNESEVLLQYLETNGNIVNDAAIPYFISPEELMENMQTPGYHIIDVRTTREFNRGHIANAINIQPKNILEYFENSIEPNSFNKIVILCNNAHLSGYVVAILRMLGYENTFHIKYGMSAWNEQIARRYWSANISDDMVGRLEVAPHPKNEPGKLPALQTGKTNGYDILRAQAEKALNINWDDISINYMDVMEQVEDYYVMCYWPEALYNQGHLPGAIQYNPKKSLHSTEEVLTLPPDQPIVPYCFTGQNAAYVNAFLAIMGYNFRSLEYGANGFMHQTMQLTQPAGRYFGTKDIKNFPLERTGLETISTQRNQPGEAVEITTAAGGC